VIAARQLAEPKEHAMAEQIDNRLIYEILKSVQGRLTLLEGMCGEMRNMLALLRTRGTRRDAAVLEVRLAELERTLERLERRLAEDRS
jgi:hypothetical protein